MPSRFGPALREARTGSGMTLDVLSTALGFSKTYLSDVERGLRPPLASDKILQAASVCGVKPETLIVPAARDRGFVDIPVTDAMNDDLLAALVHLRAVIGKHQHIGFARLRALIVRRGR